MSARRWISIDAYLAAAGESWATVGDTQPGRRYGTHRPRPVDEDQEQTAAAAPARATRTRTTKATPPPRP